MELITISTSEAPLVSLHESIVGLGTRYKLDMLLVGSVKLVELACHSWTRRTQPNLGMDSLRLGRTSSLVVAILLAAPQALSRWVLIFLSSIKSHFLRGMETFGLGPGCGPSPAVGGLNLELSDHSVEWWYLVKDHDMDPIQYWGDSTLHWVTILLNGRHLVRDQDVDPV